MVLYGRDTERKWTRSCRGIENEIQSQTKHSMRIAAPPMRESALRPTEIGNIRILKGKQVIHGIGIGCAG